MYIFVMYIYIIYIYIHISVAVLAQDFSLLTANLVHLGPTHVGESTFLADEVGEDHDCLAEEKGASEGAEAC